MKKEILIKIFIGLFICIAGVLFILARSDSNDDAFVVSNDGDFVLETEQTSGSVKSEIRVHICGEVVNPGLYDIPSDARLSDLIELAGGFSDDADREYLNLAKTLEDGEQIKVPSVEEAKAAMEASKDAADGMVNINKATEAELTELSGIGTARAQAIIAYRNEHGRFNKIEDIMNVSGIKEAAFAKIKDKIKVD